MNEIIEVRFKTLWNAPVHVITGDRLPFLVHGPEDAIQFLCVRWPPPEKGLSHARATKKCLEAVSHRAPVEAARTAFVTACLEAHLVRDGG